MKRDVKDVNGEKIAQPPSGGCVLKLKIKRLVQKKIPQPPSGGCVLKLRWNLNNANRIFSRLQAAVC